MEPQKHDRESFPSPTVFAFLAVTITVIALIALLMAGAAENAPATFGQGAWCIGGAVIPAWLSYLWFDEGHDMHGAVAFTLSIGLTGLGLILML